MSVKMSRSDLLTRLEGVQPGLSPREVIQQSSCFCFRGGRIETYNQLIFCRAKSGLPDKYEGAVEANKVLTMLKKLPDEDVEIEFTDKFFILSGIRKQTKFALQAEITLPTDKIEKPKKEGWRPLPDMFTEAVAVVQECASRDVAEEALVCVHFHPKWVEASDNFQGVRYKIKTRLDQPFLVKRESIRHLANLGMSEINETDAWVHFRNKSLRLSCPRFVGDYPNLKPLFEADDPAKIKLPKKLDQAADRAMLFSQENSDDDQITLVLTSREVLVVGEGVTGEHTERLKMKYRGPDMQFRIGPKLLMEISKRHTEASIAEDKLIVDGGSWKYSVALTVPKDKDEKAKDKEARKRDKARRELEGED